MNFYIFAADTEDSDENPWRRTKYMPFQYDNWEQALTVNTSGVSIIRHIIIEEAAKAYTENPEENIGVSTVVEWPPTNHPYGVNMKLTFTNFKGIICRKCLFQIRGDQPKPV